MTQQKNGVSLEQKKTKMVTFEEAITLAGNGKFQLRAVVCAGLCLFAVLTEATMASYLLPAANCDLNLSLQEKGLLGSSVFVGFASSALLWGAVGDVCGRRKTMMTTLFVCAFSTLLSSLAPSFLPLLVFRFFSGFFSCAASGLLYVYAGEFCNNVERPRAVLVAACLGAAGVICLPGFAWLVIPQPWIIEFPGLPLITSWRIFLGVCSIPSFTAAFYMLFFLPESPKYLLSRGREKEALEVCKTIFHINTGKPKSEYQVEMIEDDGGTQQTNKDKSILRICWDQIAPLFGHDLLGLTLLTCTLQLTTFFGFTAMIMWMPEMFNRLKATPDGSATLCDVISVQQTNILLLDEVLEASAGVQTSAVYNSTEAHTCDPTVDYHVFLYGLFLTTAGAAGNIIAGILISPLGKRNLFVSMLSIAALLIAVVPYLKHHTLLIIVYCSSLSFAGAGPGIIAAGTIDLFPTSLRGMATCMSMMTARIGAVLTTVAFGALLDFRCEFAFFMLCGVLLVCALLGIRLPAR
ncbi:synaptic vesicle glycoprotein 2A-like [Neocloeon triangulifer]|uniref:synaptic vesicle glycoprotein 2A-like n=1 Tax=Neocloeon triangulifer TaxID=2078957 RepID=UPI00286F20E5|nr:synaptic vesicle glycoprotein 2A-like [Neocloeon triangulifer]